MREQAAGTGRKRRLFVGLICLGLGVALNEWVVSRFFIPDGRIDSAGLRELLWIGSLAGISTGLFLLFRPAPAPALRRPLRQRLLLTGAATLLALCLAEGLLRLLGFQPWPVDPFQQRIVVTPGGSLYDLDPVTGYALRPGRFSVRLASGYTFRTRHLDDATRATRPDAAEAKAPDEARALWLFGCSFTYGWSLNDGETYAWKLQRRLPAYDVVNFGVPGYGTVQSLLQFREALAGAEPPALVVLAYASFHDARNTFSRTRRKEVAPYNRLDALSIPKATMVSDGHLVYTYAPVTYRAFPMARHSALFNLADDVLNTLEQRRLDSPGVSRALITTFADVARRHGSDLVVAGLTADPATEAMLTFCRRQGIPSVDLSVDLTRPGTTNLPYDPHPSAAANTVYADRLAAYIAGL